MHIYKNKLHVCFLFVGYNTLFFMFCQIFCGAFLKFFKNFLKIFLKNAVTMPTGRRSGEIFPFLHPSLIIRRKKIIIQK